MLKVVSELFVYIRQDSATEPSGSFVIFGNFETNDSTDEQRQLSPISSFKTVNSLKDLQPRLADSKLLNLISTDYAIFRDKFRFIGA